MSEATCQHGYVFGADGGCVECRRGTVHLELTDQEAHDVHHALATVVDLIDQVGAIPREAPLYGARPRLVTVAQRLDHERRHHGTVPNPNGPETLNPS